MLASIRASFQYTRQFVAHALSVPVDTLQKLFWMSMIGEVASCGFSHFHQGETVLSGLVGEELDLLLPMSLFVVSGSPVDIFLSISQHAVNESRQFGGHGSDRFRRTQPCAKASELCSR